LTSRRFGESRVYRLPWSSEATKQPDATATAADAITAAPAPSGEELPVPGLAKCEQLS
jgi:hypothetical protein